MYAILIFLGFLNLRTQGYASSEEDLKNFQRVSTPHPSKGQLIYLKNEEFSPFLIVQNEPLEQKPKKSKSKFKKLNLLPCFFFKKEKK